MKKISSILVALVAVLGFTSCETNHDDNPVMPNFPNDMQVAYLNEPVMADQYIDITDDNNEGTLHLTCSQPKEYGYAASIRYVPQISLTPDFAEYRQYDNDWSAVCSDLKLSLSYIAEGVAEMLGATVITDLPEGYYPIYVRYVANLYTDLGVLVPGHTIISNVVKFNYVHVGYLAIWTPGIDVDLYLVGTLPLADWGFVPEYQFHTATDKNTWETNTIEFAAGSKFKLSPALWNAPFNGAPFNAGTNGSDIEIDTPYVLNVDSSSSDIYSPNGFKGVVRLTWANSTYSIRLIPD